MSEAAEAFREKMKRATKAEENLEPGFYWAKWYGSGPWIPVKVVEHWNGELTGFYNGRKFGVIQPGSANVCRADQYTFGERIKEPE